MVVLRGPELKPRALMLGMTQKMAADPLASCMWMRVERVNAHAVTGKKTARAKAPRHMSDLPAQQQTRQHAQIIKPRTPVLTRIGRPKDARQTRQMPKPGAARRA